MKTPEGMRPLAEVWAWQESAACRGLDSSVFYSPSGERKGARQRRAQRAQRICFSCAVRAQCAEFAFSHGETHGVWGGLSERERDTMRESA
ncbi:WhiB family transcriptional regulator [[Kitasatospora] papulosa]|uniref:WhiB family transcriptional regulator n=1 Tax=[Kitasatospora] papulosa TaxID=1464011 RepID=UPI00369C37C5